MKQAKSLRWMTLLAMLLGFVQVQCLLLPDDTEHGDRVVNQRPSVRITAGAATADTFGVDYKVLFRWNGFDSDGVISEYQWAVDDTLSEDAWNDTTGFSALMKFRASTIDPSDPDQNRFTDWHTFYIRAVDNEFAVSRPDYRFFNARTIAPRATLTFPDISGQRVPQLQRTLVVRWDGEDLDSSAPEQKPVAYDLKLVQLPRFDASQAEVTDSLNLGNNLLLDTLRVGSKRDWLRVPASRTDIRLADLPAGRTLAFAVRAIDEAGAVQPEYVKNQNYIVFTVTDRIGQPIVTMTEVSVGEHNFPGDGDVWPISVPTNRPLRFKWTGDASDYGSLPGRTNYALDIPDVSDENRRDPNGRGGWIGWSTWKETVSDIVFSDADGGTTHHFYLKMRDISDTEESERLCHVEIFVVPFSFEKFCLIVDDAKFPGFPPTDGEHDAFLKSSVLRRFLDLGDVDDFAMYPPQGSLPERSAPIPEEGFPLELLARYQHIVWSFSVGVHSSAFPLYTHEVEKTKLTSYLSAGGRFFMVGGRLSGALLKNRPLGGFNYPKLHPDDEEPGFTKDTFIWRMMRIRNEIVSIPSDGSSPQKQASGMIAARSLNPAYPDIPIDRVKWDPFAIVDGSSFRGGIGDWEGVQGNYRPFEDVPGLDSLYTVVTMDTTLCCGAVSSGLQDAVIAQRFESTSVDTLEGTQQGRTMIFDFQPYWFEERSLIDAGTAAVNWLITGRDH